ncbi:MAG TPA: hypothetical protein PKE38_15275 [Ignavibacteriaceae bacterium]|nr:hypothetical protein [Ignavibacteriaceae bacterium]
MKKHKILLTFIISMLTSILVFNQTIPTTINYQGVLKDAAGIVVANGDYNITFKLYDASVGGTELWSETKLVNVVDGIINTKLGSVTPLTLPFDDTYWLGVTIAAGSELTPRIELASVPYSFMSMNVPNETLTAAKIADGQVVKSLNNLKDNVTLVAGTNITITPSGNNLTINAAGGGTGNIDGSGTANYVPIFTGSSSIGNSTLSQDVAGMRLVNNLSNNINPTLSLSRTGTNVATSLSFTNSGSTTMSLGLRIDGKFGISTLNKNVGMDDALVIDVSTNNIGIGTASPEGLLHITRNGSKQLVLGHNNQPTSEWYFDVDGTSLMTLFNEGRGTPITTMSFDPNHGYVGIGGVVNPSSPLEVGGTVKITGSTSEVNRTQTGNANLVPIAYANVTANGVISTEATTDNVTLATHTPGSGNYYFNIAGENIYYTDYVCIATINGTSGGEIFWASMSGQQLAIYTRDSAGAASDKGFTFVLYKK